MISGRHNDYFWVEWKDGFLSKLLDCVPEIVLDHYLINTSFDSGNLTLSDEEQQQGWRSDGKLTYSPRIMDVRSIPYYGFDEWLVFADPKEIQSWEAIVNHHGFSLADPIYESLHERFWSQIEGVRSESYLADGDRLIFVTRNQKLSQLASALRFGKGNAVTND